jgi:ATP-dependent protease ClpP protease subunit
MFSRRTVFNRQHRPVPSRRSHLPHMTDVRGQRREPGWQWYRIENFVTTEDGQTSASVYIYDEIGWYGVTAQDFVRDLMQVTASEIHVHINSPGGDVFDGVAIYNALLSHPANIIVHVDGLAASAASFIAQAGDTRLIARNAQMMIHDAQGVCMGAAVDMREMADLLDKASDNIADIYSTRCGGTKKQWRGQMEATVWYSAAEAVQAGLADKVEDVGAKTTNRAVVLTAQARAQQPPAEPAEPVAEEPGGEPEPDEQLAEPVEESPAAEQVEPLVVAAIDPSLFRAAVEDALDPHPDFDAGGFRDVMRAVAVDAPAPPRIDRPNAVEAPAVEPEPEPAPEPVEGPHPDFDATRFQALMDGLATDAPAPPQPRQPDPEPVERVVVVREPAPSTEAVLVDYLRTVLTDAANDVPALPDPPKQAPVPPPPVLSIDKSIFDRSLREAL